jgi:hypothetical protein
VLLLCISAAVSLDKAKPVRWFYKALNIPYIYDYIELCREQAEVIQNYEYVNVCDMGKSETRHRKYKWLKLGGEAYDRSSY